MKKAKIICTIGPSSSNIGTLRSMIRNGMNVARLNFSHGTHADHQANIMNIRKAADATKTPIAILQDLQGIKLRIGTVKNGSITLRQKNMVTLCAGKGTSAPEVLFIDYRHLLRDVKKGDRVLLDDGMIHLLVKGMDSSCLRAQVIEGGALTARKGVNFPDSDLRISSFTKKDRMDLDFGLKAGIDFVAVSFVRSASDILKVKRHMSKRKSPLPVIAKIEKPEAVKNIDHILEVSDGIMVARGDLGVEMSTEQVPVIQKILIQKANDAGKVVITATQMLESMTEHLRPTRAEANDVAGAIIDGSDALMLSAETSKGRYPAESVDMMRRIIENIEDSPQFRKILSEDVSGGNDYPYAAAHAAVRAAADISARAIVAFTSSGYTARLVSKFRPATPIIAFTINDRVERQLGLAWGVTPLLIRPIQQTDQMIMEVERQLVRNGFARKGHSVVIIASSPLSISGKTNFIKLHKIS